MTLKGEKMASRVAASLLAAVGLEKDLVVSSYAGIIANNTPNSLHNKMTITSVLLRRV